MRMLVRAFGAGTLRRCAGFRARVIYCVPRRGCESWHTPAIVTRTMFGSGYADVRHILQPGAQVGELSAARPAPSVRPSAAHFGWMAHESHPVSCRRASPHTPEARTPDIAQELVRGHRWDLML